MLQTVRAVLVSGMEGPGMNFSGGGAMVRVWNESHRAGEVRENAGFLQKQQRDC